MKALRNVSVALVVEVENVYNILRLRKQEKTLYVIFSAELLLKMNTKLLFQNESNNTKRAFSEFILILKTIIQSKKQSKYFPENLYREQFPRNCPRTLHENSFF